MNIPFFLVAGELSNSDYSATLSIAEARSLKPSGTPPREENEFKLPLSGSAQLLKQDSYLIAKMKTALERALTNDLLWLAPRKKESQYYLMNVGMGTFCFLDIYLDTEDGLNFRNGISYRVRYRWHSQGALRRYMLGSDAPADFPHRCEYQLKIYERDWQNSFNNCLETRFEYRNESFPFKTDNSAPPAPWPFADYIRPAITGRYKQHQIITTHTYANFLHDRLKISSDIVLKPSLVIVTSRRRMHLGMKNEFGLIAAQKGMGSSVNADQVILTTLDSAEIYRPEFLDIYRQSRLAINHNSLSPRLKKRLRAQMQPIAHFSEAEFELERNIESALSQAMKETGDEAELKRLETIKTSFLKDVRTVADIISNELGEIGLKVENARASKYQQAWQTLHD